MKSLLLRSVLFLLLAVPLGAAPLRAQEMRAGYPQMHRPTEALQKLVGESLTYNVSFLWLHHLAEGRLTFARGKTPGTFRAELVARTRGIAALLSHHRVQTYLSIMKRGPDGHLRSLVHEAHTYKGKGKGRKDSFQRFIFNYQKRQVHFQKFNNGKLTADHVYPMEGDAPLNDFLTAFFAFRSGQWGPLAAGRRYVIPTFNRKGKAQIVVQTLLPDQRPHNSFFPATGLLCRVILDPEVFDTGGGAVYVWFDRKGEPARGLVENVLGLGDVRGVLRQ